MQLAIILAMLMLIGQNGYSQIKPIIEEFGGEEAKLAISKAEELNQIISTVNSLASVQGSGKQSVNEGEPSVGDQPVKTGQTALACHPLDPIKTVADEKILSALSMYVALGE